MILDPPDQRCLDHITNAVEWMPGVRFCLHSKVVHPAPLTAVVRLYDDEESNAHSFCPRGCSGRLWCLSFLPSGEDMLCAAVLEQPQKYRVSGGSVET